MSKVLGFMKQVARGLQVEGNFGTAHVYRSSLNAIIAYRGKDDFAFNEVTSEWLKGFEVYLRSRGCSWNTVSTCRLQSCRRSSSGTIRSASVPFGVYGHSCRS